MRAGHRVTRRYSYWVYFTFAKHGVNANPVIRECRQERRVVRAEAWLTAEAITANANFLRTPCLACLFAYIVSSVGALLKECVVCAYCALAGEMTTTTQTKITGGVTVGQEQLFQADLAAEPFNSQLEKSHEGSSSRWGTRCKRIPHKASALESSRIPPRAAEHMQEVEEFQNTKSSTCACVRTITSSSGGLIYSDCEIASTQRDDIIDFLPRAVKVAMRDSKPQQRAAMALPSYSQEVLLRSRANAFGPAPLSVALLRRPF